MPISMPDIIRNLGQIARYRHAGNEARNRACQQLNDIVRTGDAEARKQAELELAASLDIQYTRSGVSIRKTN